MASSTNYILTGVSGGQTGQMYIRHVTSQAVGTYLNQSSVNVPADTDPVDYVPRNNVTIVGLQSPANSTGTIQLIENNVPLSVFVDVSQHVASLNQKPPLAIPLKAGRTYRWKVVATMWAGA